MRIYCFFFNDTATTEIYTLSLHDALPILPGVRAADVKDRTTGMPGQPSDRRQQQRPAGDRKSTRLNSSHTVISYAVFCLKKKTSDECLIDSFLRCISMELPRHFEHNSVDF